MQQMLMAAVVADAFGVPVEGQRRGTYQVTMMTSGGAWHQPRGSWSDDTAMSLALMANLTVAGDADDLMQRFAAYMYHGAYTPNGKAFGMGNTCRLAIQRVVHDHVNPVEAGSISEMSNGNGALMRLAPLAIALITEPDIMRRLQRTHDVTCLTHRHPRAILASYSYLELLHALLTGMSLPAALQTVPGQLKAALTTQPVVLAEWDHFNRLWQPNFHALPKTAIRSTAYVVDTLEAAVWVTLNSPDLATAIITAANLGADADTVATITASLLVAAHPTAKVPISWQQALCHAAIATDVITPFVARFATNCD